MTNLKSVVALVLTVAILCVSAQGLSQPAVNPTQISVESQCYLKNNVNTLYEATIANLNDFLKNPTLKEKEELLIRSLNEFGNAVIESCNYNNTLNITYFVDLIRTATTDPAWKNFTETNGAQCLIEKQTINHCLDDNLGIKTESGLDPIALKSKKLYKKLISINLSSPQGCTNSKLLQGCIKNATSTDGTSCLPAHVDFLNSVLNKTQKECFTEAKVTEGSTSSSYTPSFSPLAMIFALLLATFI